MSSAAFDHAPSAVRRAPAIGSAKSLPSAGVRAAFIREERFGIRLAVYARLAGLIVIGVWVSIQNWGSGASVVGYFLGLIGGFAALGVIHLWLSESRYRRGWHKFVIATLELALLVFLIVFPPPGLPLDVPPAVRLRWNNELYFFLLLISTALTFSPRLVLWVGLMAALFWTGGVILIDLQPASFGFNNIGSSGGLTADWLRTLLHPDFVNPNNYITQMVLLVVSAATLSLAVWRARRLVSRQAEVERERTNLARYFSPNMIDALAQADQPLGAVRSQSAAVLFADIVGFTRLSEALPPERTMAMLREFHGRMAEAVFGHGGTLDKFIGDEVMATFGTPEAGPRDAANALACARAMQEAVARWNQERRRGAAPEIKVGIGLHYGPVVLGDIGGEQRFEFAVIGDTVNVASRLERLTRELDVGVLAADALVREVRRELGAGAADPMLQGFVQTPGHVLRGRIETVDIWGLPRGQGT